MEGNMIILLLVSSVGLAVSNPLLAPRYDNIPQCLQPRESGLCLAYFPSFYYNPSKDTCEGFIYGGCRGNENRFISFDACMAKCGGFKQETNEFKLVLETDDQEAPIEKEDQVVGDICFQPSEMGPCRAMMPRFYFNGGKCESFIYGGCQGNGNNFKSLEECLERCENKPSEVTETDSEKSGEDKSSEETSVELVEQDSNKSEETDSSKSEESDSSKSEEFDSSKSEESDISKSDESGTTKSDESDSSKSGESHTQSD